MNILTVETCVSDHHKFIGVMLSSTFAKGKPKKIFYHCYKNFDNGKFEEELKKHLSSVLDFELFHLAFKMALDRFSPLTQKVLRNNNQPFMSKTLRKAIMKRSKLKNEFNKERNAKNWSNYKQQRSYCSNLLKHAILITSVLKI